LFKRSCFVISVALIMINHTTVHVVYALKVCQQSICIKMTALNLI